MIKHGKFQIWLLCTIRNVVGTMLTYTIEFWFWNNFSSSRKVNARRRKTVQKNANRNSHTSGFESERELDCSVALLIRSRSRTAFIVPNLPAENLWILLWPEAPILGLARRDLQCNPTKSASKMPLFVTKAEVGGGDWAAEKALEYRNWEVGEKEWRDMDGSQESKPQRESEEDRVKKKENGCEDKRRWARNHPPLLSRLLLLLWLMYRPKSPTSWTAVHLLILRLPQTTVRIRVSAFPK